jgi:hypothetical protein
MLATGALAGAGQTASPAASSRRAETTLAHLRPGRDRLARAVQLYGRHYTQAYSNSPDVLLWADPRKHLFLKLEVAGDNTISAITVSSFGPENVPETSLPPSAAASGLGLRLGDLLNQALRLYGPPYFQGPSIEGGRELLLVVHKFNVPEEWPQVMETSYDPQTKRLVKITLSFPYY